MKRLAIDLRELRRPGTGIGRWTKNFLSMRGKLAPEVEVVAFGSFTDGVIAAVPGPAAPWTGLNLNDSLSREKVGLWLSPYFKIPFGLAVDAIATVHDTIPARTLTGPLLFTPRLRFALSKAWMVATVSYESKRELIEDYHVPEPKIILARNSIGPAFSPFIQPGDLDFLAGLGLRPREYLLTVIDDRPHKNLATIEEAFGRGAGSAGEEVPVVVVGTRRTDLPFPLRRVSTLADGELAILYRQSRAVLHPALEEGFGLPALEAMASGVPLILSDIPTMREIAGECASYVGPLDVDGWRSAPRASAVHPSALARVEEFHPEKTYAQLWKTILDRLTEIS